MAPEPPVRSKGRLAVGPDGRAPLRAFKCFTLAEAVYCKGTANQGGTAGFTPPLPGAGLLFFRREEIT